MPSTSQILPQILLNNLPNKIWKNSKQLKGQISLHWKHLKQIHLKKRAIKHLKRFRIIPIIKIIILVMQLSLHNPTTTTIIHLKKLLNKNQNQITIPRLLLLLLRKNNKMIIPQKRRIIYSLNLRFQKNKILKNLLKRFSKGRKSLMK